MRKSDTKLLEGFIIEYRANSYNKILIKGFISRENYDKRLFSYKKDYWNLVHTFKQDIASSKIKS